MGCVVGVLLVGLVALSGSLAAQVVQVALTGSRYARWGDEPLVFWGELTLAACSASIAAVATILAARKSRAGSIGSADALGWVGLGFLGVGGLAFGVGLLGLQVPTTPGYDVLSRGEFIFMITGAMAAAFGLLLSIIAFVAASMRPRNNRGPTNAADRPRSSDSTTPADR